MPSGVGEVGFVPLSVAHAGHVESFRRGKSCTLSITTRVVQAGKLTTQRDWLIVPRRNLAPTLCPNQSLPLAQNVPSSAHMPLEACAVLTAIINTRNCKAKSVHSSQCFCLILRPSSFTQQGPASLAVQCRSLAVFGMTSSFCNGFTLLIL